MIFLSSLFLLASTAAPSSSDLSAQEKKAAAVVQSTKSSDSVLLIDPKHRAQDYVQAFELLRKEKPSTKIFIRMSNSQSIILSELAVSSNGTLLFAKVPTNSGSKHQIIPLEEILEIAYSPN